MNLSDRDLPNGFTECRDRWLSLQKAGYDERMNRPITPSLIALDVLMSVWSFSINRKLLSKEKIIELECLINNALNDIFVRGAWASIFDEVIIEEFSFSKKNKKATIAEKQLTEAFVLLGRAIDGSLDAMFADRKGDLKALNLALFALSNSSEFIGMLHSLMDYRRKTESNKKKGRHGVNNEISTEGLKFYDELINQGIKSTRAKEETAVKFHREPKTVENWNTNRNKKL